RDLLAVPLRRLMGIGASGGALRFRDRLIEWFNLGHFTTTDARTKEKCAPRSVQSWMKELKDARLARGVEAGRGRRTAVWELVETDDGADAVNPLPEAKDLVK